MLLNIFHFISFRFNAHTLGCKTDPKVRTTLYIQYNSTKNTVIIIKVNNNNNYHKKVPHSSYHLSGPTLGFHQQI